MNLAGLSPLLGNFSLSFIPGMPNGFITAARKVGIGQVRDLDTPQGSRLLQGEGVGEGDHLRAMKALSTWLEQVAGRSAPVSHPEKSRKDGGEGRWDESRHDTGNRRLEDLFRFKETRPEGGVKRPQGSPQGEEFRRDSRENRRGDPRRERGNEGRNPSHPVQTRSSREERAPSVVVEPRRRIVRLPPSPVSPPSPSSKADPLPEPPPLAAAAPNPPEAQIAPAFPVALVPAARSPLAPLSHSKEVSSPSARGGSRSFITPIPSRRSRKEAPPSPDSPLFLTCGLSDIPKGFRTVPMERLRLHWRLQRTATQKGCRTVADVLETTLSSWREGGEAKAQDLDNLIAALRRLLAAGIPAPIRVDQAVRASEMVERLKEFLGEERYLCFEVRLALEKGQVPKALLQLSRRLGLHAEQIRQHEFRAVQLLHEASLAEQIQQVLTGLFSRLALRRSGLIPVKDLEGDRFFDVWSPEGALRLLERIGGTPPALVDSSFLVAREGRFLSLVEVESLLEKVGEWAKKTADRTCEPVDAALQRLIRSPLARGIPEDVAEWALMGRKDLLETHGGVTFLGQRFRMVVQVAESLMETRKAPVTIQDIRDALEGQLHEAALPSHNLIHTTLLRYPQFRRVAPATFEKVDAVALAQAPPPSWVEAAVEEVHSSAVPLRAMDLWERLHERGLLPPGTTEQLLAAELRRHPRLVKFLPRGQVVAPEAETDQPPPLLEDVIYDALLEDGPLSQEELEERIRPLRAFSSVSVYGVLRLETWVFRRSDERHDLVEKYFQPGELRQWVQRIQKEVKALGRPYHREDCQESLASGALPSLPQNLDPAGLFDILRRIGGFSVGGFLLTTTDLPPRMQAEPIVGSVLWALSQSSQPMTTREIADALQGRLTPRDVHRGLQRSPEVVKEGETHYRLAAPPRWQEQPGRTRSPGPSKGGRS